MPEERIDNVLYVHLANDGGIFAIWGDTGEEAWITRQRLRQELEKIKNANGMVLYSRDDPNNDPSEIAFESFKLIPELELPVKLTEEPHPSTQFGGGATTLMAAAYNGDEEVAADLVERGADLEVKDEDGQTPLMYAANAGRTAIVGLLLDRGADVDARDRQGSTPIMFAAQHGHTETVRRLLEAGPDLDVQGDHGFTALDFARQNGNDETVRLLEQAGAA